MAIRHYLTQQVTAVTVPVTPAQGRLRSGFPSTVESDSVAVTDRPYANAPIQIVRGAFAWARAAAFQHWERQGAFDAALQSGTGSASTSATPSDPSEADVRAMYAQFLLVSSLPSALTPTLDQFRLVVSPSKRAQLLSATRPKTSATQSLNATSVSTSPINNAPLLPTQTPFSGNTTGWKCNRQVS